MAVPDFQSMMWPFLQFATDGQEHDLASVREHIANFFKLSPEDRNEPLPSGNQLRLHNRVGWCRTHLKNAQLIEYVRPGVFRITERGKEVLSKNPTGLSLKILDQIPDHYAWFHQHRQKDKPPKTGGDQATPEEQMADLAAGLKNQLAGELLERIKSMDPFKFERLVLDLLLAMGYGGSKEEAATVTQKSNDEGIDGLINEDRLGLDRIYVQAKRWQNSVGRPEIQNFVGALAGKHATKGIFITTSDFTSGAAEFVRTISQRIILIGGQRLAELMIEHNLGVSRADTYEIKRIYSDYFEET